MRATPPALPLEEWEPTKDTLHLWCQVLGKTKLALTPRRNHWWNVALRISSRGLATDRMPGAAGDLELELDLVGDRLTARTSDDEGGFDLVDGLSVAEFHDRVGRLLRRLGTDVTIRAEPFGVPMTTPFAQDRAHASYDGDAARRWLEVLRWSAASFDEFAGWYSGKSSPVHVFWHSFDLALTRFSGRPAPPVPDADAVTADAYSHEAVSFGFWAGDRDVRYPAYYSYTAPEPDGLRDAPLLPGTASWVDQRGGTLALLAYDDVRRSEDPSATLLDFLQSAYEAGASRAGWDLVATNTSWSPVPVDRLERLTARSPDGGHR